MRRPEFRLLKQSGDAMADPAARLSQPKGTSGPARSAPTRTDVRSDSGKQEVNCRKLPAGNNKVELAIIPGAVCIVAVTRFIRGFQPDPPGLKRDDPGLLPPWPGSSPFQGL